MNQSQRKAAYVKSFVGDLCFWDPAAAAPNHKCLQLQRTFSSPGCSNSCSSNSENSNKREVIEIHDLKWKAAMDPVTGKTYYYNIVTLETRWKKPQEIRQYEKQQRKEARRRERAFFRDMECNIYASLRRKELIPGIPASSTWLFKPNKDKTSAAGDWTFSGMDEQVMRDLCYKQNASRTAPGRPPLPRSEKQHESSEACNNYSSIPLQEHKDTDQDNNEDGATVYTTRSQTRHSGACEKYQADSTITNPDVTATIRGVCAVFRAHMIQGQSSFQQQQQQQQPPNGIRIAQYAQVFRDDYDLPKHQRSAVPLLVPTLDDIVTFYSEYYETSKMQEDTIIISLVYLERLITQTKGMLCPTPENWRSLLFSCMILASKVWDDFSMWNVDFSAASALTGITRFSLKRINKLEVAILACLSFNVRVMDSDYAKYYFLIRKIMVRSKMNHNKKKMQKKPAATAATKAIPAEQPRRSQSVDWNTLASLHPSTAGASVISKNLTQYLGMTRTVDTPLQIR